MRYFKLSEFDSPDMVGSGAKMQQSTLKMLDETRHEAGVPFVITSGYRTPYHNAKVGGVNGSSHTKGYAVDISCKTSSDRFKIVSSAIRAGFKRIGVSDNFIHLDNDPTKPYNLICTY